MSLNSTPNADRVHIGLFGKRNAGKSSIMNAITGQDLAIVSEVKGTTTDPVSKAMELLPLGPVVFIDTPGLDDTGKLGEMRIKKAYQALNKTDIALLIADSQIGLTDVEYSLIERFRQKNIPYIVVMNKSDLSDAYSNSDSNTIYVSARTKENIQQLKEMIAAKLPDENADKRIVGDLLRENDLAVLVVPIDSAAPKGRLILPQQQTIRDILESGAAAVVTRETEYKNTLAQLGEKPRIVITDSQVFEKVSEETPADIPLTSFSILFARYKAGLDALVRGAKAVHDLKDGDIVLISEGCTHHRQCNDIGSVKIPAWLRKYTGRELKFEFTSGTEFPNDLSKYRLIVHCGGCMLNEREMKYRVACASDQKVPIVNYGVLISELNGILDRTIRPFSLLQKEDC